MFLQTQNNNMLYKNVINKIIPEFELKKHTFNNVPNGFESYF